MRNWDYELKEYVGGLTNSIGTILLGRNLAEGFIDHWRKISMEKDNPDYEAGRIFYETEKFVFSRSLTSSRWEHTTVIITNLKTFVQDLKRHDGADIVAYGGTAFIHSLVETGLIDEYNIFINPTAIVGGHGIFPVQKTLKLVDSKRFPCGVLALRLA